MHVTITLDRQEIETYGAVLGELADVCRFLPLVLLKDRFLESQVEDVFPSLPTGTWERYYLEWDIRFRREAEFYLFKYLLTKIDAAIDILPKLLALFTSPNADETKIGNVDVGEDESRIKNLDPEWVGQNLSRLISFDRLKTEIRFIQLFFYDLVVTWHRTKKLEEAILPLTIQERYIRSEAERIKGVQVLLSIIRKDVEQLKEQKRQEASGLNF